MRILIAILIAFTTAGCSLSVAPDAVGQLNIHRLPAPATIPVLPPGSTSAAPLDAKTPAQWTSCTVTGELHVRTLPAADAPVLDYLQAGQIVVASIGKYGEWRQVHLGQLDGWAHGAWLDCGG